MSRNFDELVKIFEILHSEKGCPWDKKQTHKSLLKYLKEETREFIQAVKANDISGMKEELGDILLQVMFHSQIARKENRFTIDDVINHLIKKLKKRHPHVFGKKKVRSVKDVLLNWEAIKKREKLISD